MEICALIARKKNNANKQRFGPKHKMSQRKLSLKKAEESNMFPPVKRKSPRSEGQVKNPDFLLPVQGQVSSSRAESDWRKNQPTAEKKDSQPKAEGK